MVSLYRLTPSPAQLRWIIIIIACSLECCAAAMLSIPSQEACPAGNLVLPPGVDGVHIEMDTPGFESPFECTVVVYSGDPNVRLDVSPPRPDAPGTLPQNAGVPTIGVYDGNATLPLRRFVNPLFYSSSSTSDPAPLSLPTCGPVATITFQQYPPCGGMGCILAGPLRFTASVSRVAGGALSPECIARVDDTQAPPCIAASPGVPGASAALHQRVVVLAAGAVVHIASGDLVSMLSCPLLLTTEVPGVVVEVEVTSFADVFWSGAYVTLVDGTHRGLLHQAQGSDAALVGTPTVQSCDPFLRLELHTPPAMGPWVLPPSLILMATVRVVPSDGAHGPCTRTTHALQMHCSDVASPSPPPVVQVGNGDRLTLLPLPPLPQWVQVHAPGVTCLVVLEARDGISAVAFAVETIMSTFETTGSSYSVTVRDGRSRCGIHRAFL